MLLGVRMWVRSSSLFPITAVRFDTTAADSVHLLIFGTAESAVTIIAVSIPILRALLYITPPKPRFIQELYEETPRDETQPPRDFGSAIELVALQRHETGRSDRTPDSAVADSRMNAAIG
jgi:hypothetical protein